MKAQDWIHSFAEALGERSPSSEEFAVLLDLAGTAAHASERIAAPVACYLAGRAGIPLEEAKALAVGVTDR
jgi:uncharacterized protein DUF6457